MVAKTSPGFEQCELLPTMDSLLFVKTSSLGDVVHNMPAVTEARRRWPEAHIGWVVEEAFAPLARLHPGINEVIAVATRRWRRGLLSPATWRDVGTFRGILQARRYDRVVDTQGLLRSALIAAQARGECHGYDRHSIREPMASWFYDVRHAVAKDQHAVLRNRALAGLSLDFAPSDVIDYGLSRHADASSTPYAVLLHGTSRADKEWRESNWIGLGQALRRKGFGVLLPWGTEAERVRGERLAGAIKGSEVLPRRPLDETARVIANAALVAGVDTGLLHLAAAYAVPLIGVFITTDPKLTGPIGPGPIEIVGGKGDYPGYARAVNAAERLLTT
jgi:heptosyltransferase-1